MTEEVALTDLVSVKDHQVVSRTITKGDTVSIVLLAFSEGESVSEEKYYSDVLYLVIEGEAVITLGGTAKTIHENRAAAVPAGVLHGISGNGSFKIMQILL